MNDTNVLNEVIKLAYLEMPSPNDFFVSINKNILTLTYKNKYCKIELPDNYQKNRHRRN